MGVYMTNETDVIISNDLLSINIYLRGLEDGMLFAQRKPDEVDKAIEHLKEKRMNRIYLKYLRPVKQDPAPLAQHECTSAPVDE